ncbi:T9SS type A sorting domain-containing protein [Lewinella sp. W8]|uniref:T9SS type A sorting domain-containing protein n=1 Tax=Lewinella sp. W8 TaxID=2528208 RepID=UPI00106879CB|nr:T9SS type A sorting domain-containing protein [Lewinella sp. W8]MTB50193.1 T9SS type A sorting domain-containing protein [Lewinella sp. W8]
MAKTLPLFLLLVLSFTVSAQITLTTNYFPMAGDTLRFSVADSTSTVGVDLLTAGPDRSWDFGTLVPRFNFTEPVESTAGDTLFPNADVRIRTNVVNLSYYELTDSSFNLVGVRGRLDIFPDFELVTPVSPQRPARRAPLTYENSFMTQTANSVVVSPDSLPQTILILLGDAISGVDSIRITTISTREDEIDAYGDLTLNGTSYEVLREKRVETINTRIAFKTGILPFLDVTPIVQSLSGELGQFLGEQEPTLTYIFWSDNSIDPIATVEADMETQTATSISYKRAGTTSSTSGPRRDQASISVYPNPAQQRATFEIEGLTGGEHSLYLISMTGQKVATRHFSPLGDQTRITIDVSQLPRGIYLYSLRNDRGRTLATKRLLVGR